MRASNTRKPTRKKRINEVRIAYFPSFVRPLLRRAVAATLAAERAAIEEVSLVLVPDPEIRRLNRTFRNVDRVTDVISFRVGHSGDIYISAGRSREQARRMKHSWKRELVYLTVHGVLHLLGYSDYTPRNRARMFKRQDAIFAELF